MQVGDDAQRDSETSSDENLVGDHANERRFDELRERRLAVHTEADRCQGDAELRDGDIAVFASRPIEDSKQPFRTAAAALGKLGKACSA